MHEDKLSAEERRRLEALNQAVASGGISQGNTTDILARARRFENFIATGATRDSKTDEAPSRMDS
jgi:hypothetical protein